MSMEIAIADLNRSGLVVVRAGFRFPVSVEPIDKLVLPLFDPLATHRDIKLKDLYKFDAEDGAPASSYEMEGVIIYPRGNDDSPNIKSHACRQGWQTASLRQLISWFIHSGVTDVKVISLGPNSEDEKRRYSYDAVCGNAAPMFNYATPGKLDVCVDPVWVDWPSWANFLLVRETTKG